MRLTESMYWIACGFVGPYFTNRGDCNVYLLKGPGGYVMIDAGCGQEPERIEQQLAWDGVALRDIKAVLLTHAHVDHSMGLPHWVERCGAQVVAPQGEAERLRRGGLYYPDGIGGENNTVPCCPPDRVVADGERFELCGLAFQAIAVPGHCRAQMNYLLELDDRKVLVSGDGFYAEGRVTIFYLHDSDPEVFGQSMRRLYELDFDAFLPGHRYPVMHDGKESLKLCIERFDPAAHRQK